MTVNTPTNVNLFDPETQRCPYDAYKTLRDEAPVYQCPATGMYVITRFDDVRQILTDTGVAAQQVEHAELLISSAAQAA